jgi:rhodanese-related sulfurtransferase
VREPNEFAGPLGHVHGAELFPMGTLPTAAEAWDRKTPILLVCRSGNRSGRVAAVLAQRG